MSTALTRIAPLDVVRQVFPGADAHIADFLLWNHTAFPFLGNDMERYRGQLLAVKLGFESSPRLCDCCPTPIPDVPGSWACDVCRYVLAAPEERSE